jgi:hypothetical protein
LDIIADGIEPLEASGHPGILSVRSAGSASPCLEISNLLLYCCPVTVSGGTAQIEILLIVINRRGTKALLILDDRPIEVGVDICWVNEDGPVVVRERAIKVTFDVTTGMSRSLLNLSTE